MCNFRRTYFARQPTKTNRHPTESQAQESGHSWTGNRITPTVLNWFCLNSSYEARLRPDAFHKALDYEFSQNRQGRLGAAGLDVRPPRAVRSDDGRVRSALPRSPSPLRSRSRFRLPLRPPRREATRSSPASAESWSSREACTWNTGLRASRVCGRAPSNRRGHGTRQKPPASGP